MISQYTIELKKDFDKKQFQTGASIFKIALWHYINIFIFRSGLITSSNTLVFILKLFGAKIGKQVRIKPHIYIKYPWKLHVGDYSWLAECYIDNLDYVFIGDHVCISQKAMLITGNHDYTNRTFDLFTAPITLENGVWIGANSTVCPGTHAKSHSVLCAGSNLSLNMEPYKVYKGNPAKAFKTRIIDK